MSDAAPIKKSSRFTDIGECCFTGDSRHALDTLKTDEEQVAYWDLF
jgi:hypothetical protein